MLEILSKELAYIRALKGEVLRHAQIKSKNLDGELNFNNAEYKCNKCGGFYK